MKSGPQQRMHMYRQLLILSIWRVMSAEGWLQLRWAKLSLWSIVGEAVLQIWGTKAMENLDVIGKTLNEFLWLMGSPQSDCRMAVICMLCLALNNNSPVAFCTNWNLHVGFKGRPGYCQVPDTRSGSLWNWKIFAGCLFALVHSSKCWFIPLKP